MKRKQALLGFLALLISLPPELFAQTTPPSTTPQNPSSDNRASQEQDVIFRVSTQLVQIDSIVTDKKGNHIEDLTESDFELRVDGKPQPISYLKFVKFTGSSETSTSVNVTTPRPPTPTTMPTRRLEVNQVRRTIALVVDDLGLSFSSIAFAKDALKKFVSEQMQEGDLVGIIRTSGGFGIYQQFTSDKRILYAAIDRLKFALNGRKQIPFTLGLDGTLAGRNGVFQTEAEKYHTERAAKGAPPTDALSDPREAAIRNDAYRERVTDAADEEAKSLRENVFSYGTLGALNQVVRALRTLPGRKVAIILSDGLPLPAARNTDNSRVTAIQRKVLELVELANRSSVAFYSINVQGVQSPGGDASYESIEVARPFSGGNTFDDGLRTLAYETGGMAFFNNNKTDLLLAKSVEDNRSYYLIGFDPDDEKFDRLQHKISLRVKRPDLQVRTRNGFFGIEDSTVREIPKTREAQILNALFSPFGANEIPFQVTSLFYSTTAGDPVIRSYFHIDCSKLQFKDEDNSEKSLTLELANFTFDESGAIVERYAQSFQLRLNEVKYRQVLREGLTYLNDFPVKKPGAYHFRSALRESVSGQLGSSSQFILIPDLKKDRLALSGVILNVVEKNVAASDAVQSSGDVLTTQLQANPAARRFASNSELEYQAAIYNPKLDRQTNKPKLRLQFELYRENQRLFQSPERDVKTDRQKDPKWLDCGGRFQLNRLTPGEYWLRLLVRDDLRDGKFAVAEQWIDFTIR